MSHEDPQKIIDDLSVSTKNRANIPPFLFQKHSLKLLMVLIHVIDPLKVYSPLLSPSHFPKTTFPPR